MPEKPIQQVFTPAGGMNQDDSIVTPTVDTAGHSAFEAGDYRYAQNARIGSSKDDSFGDLENIKDTVEVTDYFVKKILNTNPNFTSSLSPWLQTSDGNQGWIYASDKAQLNFSGSLNSHTVYQTFLQTFTSVTIRYLGTTSDGSTSSGLQFLVVFLTGGVVISTQVLESGNLRNISATKNFTVPDGCDGVGFKLTGTTPGITLNLDYFYISSFIQDSIPSGTEKTIGKYEDYEFQCLYYAVWNSNDDHCIRKYDPSTNRIYEILRWTGLKFKSDYFVKFAKLDNWIALTDRNNNPRLIDVNTINDLFIELNANGDFREFHISFKKWSPVMPPILRSYYDGVTNNHEKIKEKVYPFSYRYIYFGGLNSRWSPISVWANPTDAHSSSGTSQRITSIEVYIPGFLLDDPDVDLEWNYFDHTNIKFKKAVQYIEIAYNDSVLGLWRLFKRIDVSTMVTSYYFSGDADTTPIPNEDFIQPFDTVPFKAGTVEAIDNRFVFGDCLDELDAADAVQLTNVAVNQQPTDIASLWSSTVVDITSPYWSSITLPQAQDIAARNNLVQRSFKGRGKYKICIQYLHSTGWRSAGYTNDSWTFEIPAIATASTLMESINSFSFKLVSSMKPPSWAVAYQIMVTNCLNIDQFLFGACNSFNPLIDNITSVLERLDIPQSYKDKISSHFENTRLITGQDALNEINKETIVLRLSNVKNAELKPGATINSLSATSPIQYILQSELRGTKQINVVGNCSRLFIDINNWYQGTKADASGNVDQSMNNIFYNWREGDRVRFTGSRVANPTLASQLETFDGLIQEFTGRGLVVERPQELLWIPPDNESGPVAGFKHYIEVYTPKIPTQEDYIYYEKGEWYPVLHPGTDNRAFSKTDWTWTNLGAVTCVNYGGILNVFSKLPFFSGDIHSFTRQQYCDFFTGRANNLETKTPSMSPIKMQTYSEWEKCNGRPTITYRTLPTSQFVKTEARFGGKIVEESLINALNRFQEFDKAIYPSEYGRIRGMENTSNAQVESVGSILLCIGERETWSVYVNRTTLEDLSGRTQVSISDEVLGSFNTLLGSHGTRNPESISKKRGRVWFWDSINGTWVRYGRDGLTPISKYKMSNWFKELGALLSPKYLTDDIPKAISEFDPFNDELVTMLDHIDLPSTFRGYSSYKGALFSEKDTRWKSIIDYSPELFAKINNQLIGFYQGSLLMYESGDGYSTFGGVKYDVKIEPVFNQEQIEMKSWQTVGVVSSDPWNAERLLSEYRGQKTIQQSNIPLTLFEDKEDTYYAAVLNDENTVNKNNPLFEGQKMRSKALRVLVKLDPSIITKALLHYVTCGYIKSPKNL